MELAVGALVAVAGVSALPAVEAGERVAVLVEAGPRWRDAEMELGWKSLKIGWSAALRSRTSAGSMMVATGA